MFSLSDIIGNAQGGNVISNLARQFGLSEEQAQSAVDALVPAVSTGLQQQASDPSALGNIVSTVASGGAHQQAFDDPDAAASSAATQQGGNLLEQIFGSKTQDIAQHASQVSGVSPDIIQQMLPVLMSVIAGGLFRGMENQGLGGILGQLAGSGGLGGMLGSILGGGQGGQQAGNQPPQQQEESSSGGGLGGLIGGVLGGLFGGKSSRDESDQAPQAAPQGGMQAGLEQLINMFQPGQHVPAEQQQKVDSILDVKS